MTMVQDAGLHTIPVLSELRLRLAADFVVDASRRHEIAFIGGVDEHASGVDHAADHGNRHDSAAGLDDSLAAIQPLVAIDSQLILADEILEHPLGDVRLEDPHRSLRAVDGRRPLPLVSVLLPLLPLPRFRPVVMTPDTLVEVPGQAADDRLVAGIRETQAAARQTAEMKIRADDDGCLSESPRLYRRNHAR